jgi:hypothetical protein
MESIALRLQVIAAINPDFPRSRVYRDEILLHRAALLQHHAKMVDGVRCGTFDRRIGSKTGEIRVTHRVVACADIYTGVAAVQELPLWPTRDTAEFRRKVQALQDELRSRILEEMPLAQMKALEDALLRYADFPARIVLTGAAIGGRFRSPIRSAMPTFARPIRGSTGSPRPPGRAALRPSLETSTATGGKTSH